MTPTDTFTTNVDVLPDELTTPVDADELAHSTHPVETGPAIQQGPPVPSTRRLVSEQALVLVGQGLSGLGNLAYLLIASRLLAPAAFAGLATFLALYLVLLMPSLGLSAGSSSAPHAAARIQRRAFVVGGVVAVGLLAASAPLGATLHLAAPLVALLGVALPLSAPLALARGRLYGETRPLAVTASLVAEPLVRLTAGIALMRSFGATGAATGVVAAGYSALAVAAIAARRGRRKAIEPSAHPSGVASAAGADPEVGGVGRRLPWLTVVAFTLLAVVQNQDVVFANGLLSGSRAGEFAALSAIGGIAAFATSTIPLVLLPRLRAADVDARRAVRVALSAAAGLGAIAVAVAWFAPTSLYVAVVGSRYAAISTIATAYLVAMALLGVSRVAAAQLLGLGRSRIVVAFCLLAAGLQEASICLAPRTAQGVALSTLLATAVLSGGLGAAGWVASKAPNGVLALVKAKVGTRSALITSGGLFALTGLALTVRLIITRGLWLDEATSVFQARMSYSQMLHNLKFTDVHPPGYFSILWVWIRMFGDGPLSVRMPGILLGVVTVPVVYFATKDIYRGRATAWVAAGFAAVAPQMVWYSQEARMYGVFMLLTVLAVWAQVRAVRSNSWKAWFCFAIASAGLLWTQYFSILVVLAQQLVFAAVVIRRWRDNDRRAAMHTLLRWAVAGLVFAALIAPLVPFVHQQFVVNQNAGKGFNAPSNTGAAASSYGSGPVYIFLANLLWAAWGYHSTAVMTALGALWPAGMLVALLLLGRGRSRVTSMLVLVALLPVVLLFAVGLQKRFLFDLRYFIGCVPLLIMVGARAVTTWPKRAIGAIAATALLGCSLVAGLADQQLNGSNPRRYDFQPALANIAAVASPRDQLILDPSYLGDLSRYYQPQLNDVPARGQVPSIVARTKHDQRVFVLGSFFHAGNDSAQISDIVDTLGRHRTLVRRWSYANVKVWEFS
jgi:O-antigen/teichoic acid export membrane protein